MSQHREELRIRRLTAGLFLFTFLCFARCLSGGFVWDDWSFVVGTLGYRGFEARRLAWMFTTLHQGDYGPLVWLSYAVDYAFWGMRPLGFHLTNLLLHCANAALFFQVALRLLRRACPRWDAAVGATAAAVFFAVHPLRVESVAWISERRDVLAGFFFFATLLFYLKACGEQRGRASWGWLALSVASFALAGLSKPIGVPLPAALLLLDYYPLDRLKRPWERRQLLALLAEKIPYALISVAVSLLAIRAQAQDGRLALAAGPGLEGRLAQAVYALGFYAAKTAVPARLSALYPSLSGLGFGAPAVLVSAFVLAGAASVLVWLGVPAKANAALWGWYALFLLPVLGLIKEGPHFVALRFSYLPCLGWALLAGAGVARARPAAGNRLSARGLAFAASCVAALLVNIPLTWAQAGVWRDDRTLWDSVLARFPQASVAHLNLAGVLLREGDFDAAQREARETLRLSADDPMALLFLAHALEEQGRLDEAQETAALAARVGPDSEEAQTLLGLILERQRRFAQALEPLRRAARLRPTSARAQGNLAAALALLGRFGEAEEHFSAAARLDPSDPLYPAQAAQAARDREKRGTR